VICAEQLGKLDPRPDLLHALAHRGRCGILVVVDKAAWQAPQPAARLGGPAAEHDATLGLDDHGGGHFRIAPKNE